MTTNKRKNSLKSSYVALKFQLHFFSSLKIQYFEKFVFMEKKQIELFDGK